MATKLDPGDHGVAMSHDASHGIDDYHHDVICSGFSFTGARALGIVVLLFQTSAEERKPIALAAKDGPSGC